MKAILILDMPKGCCECKLMSEDMYCKGFIPYTYENVAITKMCVEDYVMRGTRHSHCPLKPIPKRKQKIKELPQYTKEYEAYSKGEVDGWNFCLDEILGEEYE